MRMPESFSRRQPTITNWQKLVRKQFSNSAIEHEISGKEAADTYKQLAGIYTKLGSQHEAATAYVEASKALTKMESEGAVTEIESDGEVGD